MIKLVTLKLNLALYVNIMEAGVCLACDHVLLYYQREEQGAFYGGY